MEAMVFQPFMLVNDKPNPTATILPRSVSLAGGVGGSAEGTELFVKVGGSEAGIQY